ncbi:MAG TPA: metallopeptidase family protein [Candidatus Saccharimonadales bacterium]|nr:metallopeptidase family protein [Candidatus Saccharimonadales bacterium]
MVDISEKDFEAYVAKAIDNIPDLYRRHLDNVAFLIEDEPTPDQRRRLNLYVNETLFGLYEGVPLPQRGGAAKILPDKITLFRLPLTRASANLEDFKKKLAHTIWHEVAHYYGLDHARIHELEYKNARPKL